MILALIPARAGSVRIPGKNLRPLGGHPLLAYSIAAARRSDLFAHIAVSTESAEIAHVATQYGAEVIHRPAQFATAESPDFEWVAHALAQYPAASIFAILRPTSPFRTPRAIRAAFVTFVSSGADSLRAVSPVRDHPAKMWIWRGDRIVPFLGLAAGQDWHSRPTQTLPVIYRQNASLEFGWVSRTVRRGTIAGNDVCGIESCGREGFDINTEDDWILAESEAAHLCDPSVFSAGS